MRATPPLAALLLVALSGGGPARGDDPPKKTPEKPFPVGRTVVLRETDCIYVVEGRQVIPAGIEITGQKGIRVVGRSGAVLEVRGSLVVHGIPGTKVRFSGLRIELAETVQQFHLDHCDLSGAPVVTPEGKSTSGSLTVENCDGLAMNVALLKGKLNLMSVLNTDKIRIRGQDPPNGKNAAYGMVYGCKLTDGLEAENFADLTVRTTLLAGSPLRLKDNRLLLFDGNLVESVLTIEHAQAGQFKGTTFTKCDIAATSLRFFAPADPAKSDSLLLDKCWFNGVTDAAGIAKVVEDAADDPKNNVKVKAKNPMERPHEFVKRNE